MAEPSGGPTLDEAIAQAFAQIQGGQAAVVHPIGVPDTYLAPAPERGTTAPLVYPDMPKGQLGPPAPMVAPQYFEGDEFTPAGLSVEDLAELQRRMFDAGLYNPAEAEVAKLGIWDDSSRNAYTRLLGFANQTGLAAEAALGEYRSRTEAGGFTGTGVLQENPANIRALAQQTALRRTGRQLDEQQLSAFERAYRSEVENPGLGVSAPDPAVFAEAQIGEQDPGGVVDYRILQAQNEWMSAIRSPVGETG